MGYLHSLQLLHHVIVVALQYVVSVQNLGHLRVLITVSGPYLLQIVLVLSQRRHPAFELLLIVS